MIAACHISITEEFPEMKPTDKNQLQWIYLPLQEPNDINTPVVNIEGRDQFISNLHVWTFPDDRSKDVQWAKIIGFSRVKRYYMGEEDLIRIHTDHGTTLDMNHYNFQIGLIENFYIYNLTIFDTEGEGSVPTAQHPDHKMCTVVYGDTDSLFCLIGAKHLKQQAQKIAYAGIVAALISYRITGKLRLVL